MRKLKFFAALCCTAMLFAACGKNEPEMVYSNDDEEENTEEGVTVSGSENGHNYVDLGLSVKWATCNVGATKPEGYGNYYAWGETETKDCYLWSTYLYGSGSHELTKYVWPYFKASEGEYGLYGFRDCLSTLETWDDAATCNWWGNWRMPTYEEWGELMSNCTWTWTTMNEVNGYKVVASNGNSLFLPAAGWCGGYNDPNPGSVGAYWSSSLNSRSSDCAWYMNIDVDEAEFGRHYSSRDFGFSVRPVCK